MSNSDCAICWKKHQPKGAPEDSERVVICDLCLDCHGILEQIGPWKYRCKACHAKHSLSFAFFTRSSQLTNTISGKLWDFSSVAVISPFLGKRKREVLRMQREGRGAGRQPR